MKILILSALALSLSTFRLAAEPLESWQAILKSDRVARLQLRCHGPGSEVLKQLGKIGGKGFRLVSFTAVEEIDEIKLEHYSFRCVTELSNAGRTWARGDVTDDLSSAIESALKLVDRGLGDEMFKPEERDEITVKIDVIHEKDYRKDPDADEKAKEQKDDAGKSR